MIDLQSLSLTSAFNSIVAFFRSLDSSNKFKVTIGSEVSFLIRLLANIFSTLSYRIVSQAREVFLSTAVLPSSNIGIGVNLGYSVFRGSNLKRKVKLTPNGNYTFPKFSIIGKYDDTYDLIVLGEYEYDDDGNVVALKDLDLKQGVATDILVVAGQVKEETFTAGTSAVKCFSLFTTGISEDYILYLDAQEVPTTKVIKEMTEDKYLVRTNPYSSVDIMYLNTYDGAQYKYGNDSEFTIRYIELADVPVIPLTDSMFSYGTLNDVINISSYLPFETVDEIKINAPLQHETQNLIRSKQDYANRLSQIVPAVIDASYKPLTPTYTLISGLKNDFTLLTDSEQEEVRGLLEKERFFGTPIADITHPRREVANLKISVALTNKYKNIADINLDIDNILESFYDSRLGSTFNTYDLERRIESLSYVKYARVDHVINERKPDQNYQVGYILEYDGNYYIASNILGLSGSTVPQWSLPRDASGSIDTGLITEDGSLKWKTYKRLPNMKDVNFDAWKSGMPYGIGDYVYDPAFSDYMFKCVDIVKSSGFNEPNITYTELGNFIADGGIVWVVTARNDLAPMWSSFVTYSLGDSVNVSNNSEFSLECIGYTGTASAEENPDFELFEYAITGKTSSSFSVAGNKVFYFRAGDVITATFPEGSLNFSVVSSVFNGTSTIIGVNGTVDTSINFQVLKAVQRGTRDGQVLWNLVKDINNITYPWNGYVVFDHELEVIE